MSIPPTPPQIRKIYTSVLSCGRLSPWTTSLRSTLIARIDLARARFDPSSPTLNISNRVWWRPCQRFKRYPRVKTILILGVSNLNNFPINPSSSCLLLISQLWVKNGTAEEILSDPPFMKWLVRVVVPFNPFLLFLF